MEDPLIVPLELSDLPVLEAITPEGWSSIVPIHRRYLSTTCCHSVKAVGTGGEILGIATALDFGRTGWLAHVIVSPEHRNRGIGTLVARNRVDFLRNTRGCRTVTLTATELGYPIYRKMGFEDESLYCLLAREPGGSPGAKPGESGALFADNSALASTFPPGITRMESTQIAPALAIDGAVSGETRSVFLRGALEEGYAYTENGEVSGFYLPTLGDGGISAENERAGLALLGMKAQEGCRAFIPEENGVARAFLLERGYSETRKIHRMSLGEPFPKRLTGCYARIGGFAG